MPEGGLYLMRFEEARAQLEIALMDWANVRAIVRGPAAGDLYAHFLSLADHGIRDAYAYGVVSGLDVAAKGRHVTELQPGAAPVAEAPR